MRLHGYIFQLREGAGLGFEPRSGALAVLLSLGRGSGSFGSRSCSLPTPTPGLVLTFKIGLLFDQQAASPNSLGSSGMRGDLVGVCTRPHSFPLLPHTHLLWLGFLFLAVSCSTWTLTSSTENQTCAPSHGMEAQHLSHCTTRQVLFLGFLPELQGVPQEAETWRVERRRRYERILFYCTLKILHLKKKQQRFVDTLHCQMMVSISNKASLN